MSPAKREHLPEIALTDLKSAIRENLENALNELGLSQDLSVIRTESSVADGVAVFAVGRGNKRAILLLSPTKFPDVISQELTKAAAMRNHLGELLGSVIMLPLAQGCLLNRSYALMPFQRPFNNNRIFFALQKHQIKSQVIEWVQNVNERHNTIPASTDDREQFVLPLQHLYAMPAADPCIRDAASTALNRPQKGRFRPRFVPMHRDLWKGNILRKIRDHGDTTTAHRFVIIDWRGSRIKGFPIFDLVRVSSSFELAPDQFNAEVIRATKILECDPVDARSYVTTALGEIAINLDQFPLDRFLQLARDCLSELRKANI
jgi:hypothetical protein